MQWFRAEAEMQRWQEQVEQKLAEFLRVIRSFKRMTQAWSQLSVLWTGSSDGHVAYARQKADMYGRMENDCKKKLDEAGYMHVRLTEGHLSDYVAAMRAEDLISFTKSLEGDII